MNQSQPHKTRKYSTFEFQTTTYDSSIDNLSFSSTKNLRKVSGDLSTISNNYKTQVCKYWQIGNQCPFKETCVFAHGGFQIRNKQCISQKYKTKLCKNFHEKVYCPYGKRCQFIHNNSYSIKIQPTQIYNWFGTEISILKQIKKKHHLKNIQQTKGSTQSSCSIQNQLQMQNFRQSEFMEMSRDEYQFSYNVEQDRIIMPEIIFTQGMAKPRLYSL